MMPKTYGVPVALFGVPRAEPLAVVLTLEAEDEPLEVAAGLLLYDELLPHPAASRAAAATAASVPALLRNRFMDVFPPVLMWVGLTPWMRRSPRGSSQ
jgi:hypothetical protein